MAQAGSSSTTVYVGFNPFLWGVIPYQVFTSGNVLVLSWFPFSGKIVLCTNGLLSVGIVLGIDVDALVCFPGRLHSLRLERAVPKAQLRHETSHLEDPQRPVFSRSFLNSQYSRIWGTHLEVNKCSLSTLEGHGLYNNLGEKIFIIFLCQKSFNTFCSKDMVALWTARNRRISTLINSVSLRVIHLKDIKFLLWEYSQDFKKSVCNKYISKIKSQYIKNRVSKIMEFWGPKFKF